MERDSRKRAEALLAQMTATEKVGQLNQHLYGFRIYHVEDGKIIFTQELKDEVKKWGGIGTIYGLYRADPWSEKNYETGLAGGLSMQAYNQLQKYVIEHSRLGIPFLLSSECPHGHQALDGYLLPVNLAAVKIINCKKFFPLFSIFADWMTGSGVGHYELLLLFH